MQLAQMTWLLIPTFTLVQRLMLLDMIFGSREITQPDGAKSSSATNAEELLKRDSLRIIWWATRSNK